MEIRPISPAEPAVRRYVEELWLPYHRELEATVDRHRLADDVDVVDEEVAFRLERLGSEGYEAWVAVDDAGGEESSDTLTDGDLAGFVTTEFDEAPSVFDRPDRLRVGDLFVHEPYRGTGFAHDLVERAAERAWEEGCAELVLEVDVDNDRAVAFYEKLGFETHRWEMSVPVGEL